MKIRPVGEPSSVRSGRQMDRGSDVWTDRQTHRHDEANSLFSQFLLKAPKNPFSHQELNHDSSVVTQSVTPLTVLSALSWLSVVVRTNRKR